MTAFRGHGFSLLAPARGMPALPAKGDFSRPSSLLLPAGSSDTCYSRKCFRWDEQCAVPVPVPGVSHLPLQTTKIESQNQVFNCNRIELFGFISEITLYENDSNKKVKLFWVATIHESGTENYSKTVHVLAVRTQFVQW